MPARVEGKIDSSDAGTWYVPETYRVGPRRSTEGGTADVTK